MRKDSESQNYFAAPDKSGGPSGEHPPPQTSRRGSLRLCVSYRSTQLMKRSCQNLKPESDLASFSVYQQEEQRAGEQSKVKHHGNAILKTQTGQLYRADDFVSLTTAAVKMQHNLKRNGGGNLQIKSIYKICQLILMSGPFYFFKIVFIFMIIIFYNDFSFFPLQLPYSVLSIFYHTARGPMDLFQIPLYTNYERL